MRIGDLVLFEDVRWLVRSYNKNTRTVTLCDQGGNKKEVPVNLDLHADKLQVLCNPSNEWNVLTVKVRPGAGPFIKAESPTIRQVRLLKPWEDWIASDPFREGGSVFIRPGFALKIGDLVIFTHRNGAQTRATVPSRFGTVASLLAKKAPIKKPEVNRFTLLDEDSDDDE